MKNPPKSRLTRRTFLKCSAGRAGAAFVAPYAVRVPGVKLEWDAARLKFTNSKAANRLVREKYRAGWEVAGL